MRGRGRCAAAEGGCQLQRRRNARRDAPRDPSPTSPQRAHRRRLRDKIYGISQAVEPVRYGPEAEQEREAFRDRFPYITKRRKDQQHCSEHAALAETAPLPDADCVKNNGAVDHALTKRRASSSADRSPPPGSPCRRSLSSSGRPTSRTSSASPALRRPCLGLPQ